MSASLSDSLRFEKLKKEKLGHWGLPEVASSTIRKRPSPSVIEGFCPSARRVLCCSRESDTLFNLVAATALRVLSESSPLPDRLEAERSLMDNSFIDIDKLPLMDDLLVDDLSDDLTDAWCRSRMEDWRTELLRLAAAPTGIAKMNIS